MWPGLLAWSTQHHDGTAPSKFTKMSAADKAFLQGAMDDAMAAIEDYNKVLMEGLELLEAKDNTPEKITTALEVVDRCVDDQDCARNLDKFGGIKTLLKFVNSEYEEISLRCCEILSLMLANNEILQLAAFEKYSALEILMFGKNPEIENNDESTTNKPISYTKPKIGLLAAVVRGHPVVTEAFLSEKYNGLSWLTSAFESENRKSVQEKVATFIRHLILEDPERAKANCGVLLKSVRTMYDNILAEPANSNLQYTEIVAEIASIVLAVSGGEKSNADVGAVKAAATKRVEYCAALPDKDDYEEEMKTLRQALNRHTLENAFEQ